VLAVPDAARVSTREFECECEQCCVEATCVSNRARVSVFCGVLRHIECAQVCLASQAFVNANESVGIS
jgi:hypothetical protein